MVNWQDIARILKAHMKRKEPEIKVRDLQELFNLSSTSRADYYLTKLEEMGFVRRVKNGDKSVYFVNWGKQ